MPFSIDPTTPAGNESLGLGDDRIRALKQYIIDVFGVPADPTTVAAALFGVVAAGLKSVNFQDAAANPAVEGLLQRNATLLKYHDGATVQTIARIVDIIAASTPSDVNPIDEAIGSTTAPGTDAKYSRYDHRHAMPAAGTPINQAFSDVAGAGAAATLARSDHKHGMPVNPVLTIAEASFAVSIDTGQTTNSLTRIYVKSNTTTAIVVRISLTGVTGGTGGKTGSPSSSVIVNTDFTVTHNLGVIVVATPSLAITSTANPFTGTLKIHYK
jgi:hypothetical protein